MKRYVLANSTFAGANEHRGSIQLTEGIQPSIIEEILEILIGLHRHQGLAIIVVEQNLDFIRQLSDRVLLIEKGTITGEVAPDALGGALELGGYIAAE